MCQSEQTRYRGFFSTTVAEALQEYAQRRKQRRVLKLFGTIDYDPDYDYKAQRARGKNGGGDSRPAKETAARAPGMVVCLQTGGPMNIPVIVQRQSHEEYTAEPLGKPELKAVAATETEALSKVGKALGDWLGSAKIVDVEVPGGRSDNPWLDAWGRSADDPDFEEYMAEIKRARSADNSA